MGVRRQGQEPPGVAGRFQTLIDLQDVSFVNEDLQSECGELRGAAGRFQALPGLLDVFFYEDQMVRADNLAGQQADPQQYTASEDQVVRGENFAGLKQ